MIVLYFAIVVTFGLLANDLMIANIGFYRKKVYEWSQNSHSNTGHTKVLLELKKCSLFRSFRLTFPMDVTLVNPRNIFAKLAIQNFHFCILKKGYIETVSHPVLEAFLTK